MQKPNLRLKLYATKTNPAGNIFGGWTMQELILAGKIAILEDLQTSAQIYKINDFIFYTPLFVGDILSIYANILDKEKLLVEIQAYKNETLVASAKAQYKNL